MESLLQDLRFGFRMLVRRPAVSAVVVLTLAFAMGANSAVFSIVDALVFRPVAVSAPDELVFLYSRNPQRNIPRHYVSVANFSDLREQLSTVEGLVAYGGGSYDLTGAEQPQRLSARLVTTDFFELMGYRLARGRGFTAEDAEAQNPGVAIVSHGLWQAQFGSDPEIAGRGIALDGESYTVIGVASAELESGLFRGTDLWLPLEVDATGARDRRVLQVVGRLAAGAGLAELEAELEPLAARLAQEYPEPNGGWGYLAAPLSERLAGPNAQLILTLLGVMVSLVLLLACANVANLMLARAVDRERETAIRAAVGAGRRRLVRQLLTENLVLSLVAGLVGLLVTWWILRGLVALTRRQIPLLLDLGIDRGVLFFTLVLVVVAPLIFGLAPMLRASRPRLAEVINESSTRSGGRSRNRLRTTLMVFQVALALVLLIFGALMVRSTVALTRIDTGFETRNLMTVVIDRPAVKAEEPAEIRGYFDELSRRLSALSGVRSAAIASHRPLVSNGEQKNLAIAGRTAPDPERRPWMATVTVGPGFFETLGVALLRGRTLGGEDTAETAPVAVVSRAAAERYWSDGDPLGAQVKLGEPDAEGPWIEVVGVVDDVRNPDADQPPVPHLYLPFAQHPSAAMSVLARTEGDPEAMSETLRRTIWEVDPDQPLEDMRSMAQIHYDDFAGSFAISGLMVLFSLLALVLAAGGLYSVVSYGVRQRYREIGIRRALGAQGTAVVRTALARPMRALGLGLALGVVAAMALGGLIANMLYGVGASDPATFLTMGLALAAVGFLAALIPARRALEIEPATVLRAE